MDSLPWYRIHEFLLEIEAARSSTELLRLAMERSVGFMDCDAGVAVFKPGPRPEYLTSFGFPDQMREDYNGYYSYHVPLDPEELIRGDGYFDVNRYRGTEYADDFCRKYGVAYGIIKPVPGTQVVVSHSYSRAFADPAKYLELSRIISLHVDILYRRLTEAERAGPFGPVAVDLGRLLETYRLSPRELEVTGLIAQGYGTQQAALRLFLSPRTVEKHLESVYLKMAVHGRKELMALIGALRHPYSR